MVLSSQSIRSDGRRMMSSDGRRIRRRGWKLFALLGLVIVFGWLGWRFFGSQSEVPATPITEMPVVAIEPVIDVPEMAPQVATAVSDKRGDLLTRS